MRHRFALAFLLLVAAGAASAASVEVIVEAEGSAIADAVVTLSPIGRASSVQPVDAVMDQIGSAFVPRVLVVPKGSRVAFPNSDRIRHQVYSFSPAKRFELPLYAGTPPAPVRFENAGVVTLGCNIHDWMKGYIVVVDTPHHALSDASGRARIAVPPGEYLLTAWHERLASVDAAPKLRVSVTGDTTTRLVLPLAPPPPPRGSDRLRALQDKFRAPARD